MVRWIYRGNFFGGMSSMRWKALIAISLLIYAFILYTPIASSPNRYIEIENVKAESKNEPNPPLPIPRNKIDEQIAIVPERIKAVQDPLRGDRIDMQKEWDQALKEGRERKLGITKQESVEKKEMVETQKDRQEEAKIEVPIPQEKTLSPTGIGEARGTGDSFKYAFQPLKEEEFVVENVMTIPGMSFEQRMTAKVDRNANPKLIVTWNTGLSDANLGGCPDWNCRVVNSRDKLSEAGAIIVGHEDVAFQPQSNQYIVYFSQESPAHSGYHPRYPDFFNMSFGFRHDTAAASPYGYTVKLAPESYRKPPYVDESLIRGKKKGAAWFVSHCSTASQRELLVQRMQSGFEVDIYGGCGTKNCPRGGDCEKMLDTDYHFYITFENSICKDYVTEKVWNQGYGRELIPVVLKRSIVESYLPPNSFIAADDYESVGEMTNYMKYLMDNKTAYMEYFNWRKDHKVVFLNGKTHDILEKPWGMCQICRLLWETPMPHHSITDFRDWWENSCESQGKLVSDLLKGSQQIEQKQ
ncbi:unnamed protein product, partial [Mesorhabditis belari]|uniref:Fucosyltransferase n=1 Tax=Mesorhabditis belari TaxID=2138241 RepID=A0AAF3EZB2_9BILA